MKTLPKRAEEALNDLFAFGLTYWGLQLEEQPHRWMCDEMQKTLTLKDTPYLMLDVPRGCYKTSISTAGAVWQYLRQVYLFDNPYHRIIYGANTLALGESFLTLIENILRVGGAGTAIGTFAAQQANGTGGATVGWAPATTAAATIDTTSATAIDFTYTQSIASATESITITDSCVEVMN